MDKQRLPLIQNPSSGREGPAVLLALHSHGPVKGPGGVALVDPSQIQLDQDVARSIPEHLAQRYRCLPLRQDDHRLMLGMEDPLNAMAIDDIRLITGLEVYPVQLAAHGGSVPEWGEVAPEAKPEQAFPLTGLGVRARVSGPLASVQLCQTFTNPFDRPVEAVYIFPLSSGAAVHQFRMRVGERVVEGEIQEKRQARQTYAQGMQAGFRSALVEQERDNIFTMKVGNIPVGEEVTIELSYAERLETDESRTSLRIPLVVAPRYIPGVPLGAGGGNQGAPLGGGGGNQGLGVANDTDQVPDASRISPPLLPPGIRSGSLSIEVELETGGLLPHYLACSQHATSQRSREGNLVISLAREDELLDRDFMLHFSLAQPKPQSLLLSGPEHFLLWIMPPQENQGPAMPRDIAFLIDRSGSMGGAKEESARRAVLRFLEQLNPQDRFTLLAFDDRMEHFRDGQWCFTQALEEARAWVEQHCQSRGGTEIMGPIQWLLQRPGEPGRLACAVLITDGEVGNESAMYQELQRRTSPVRLFTLGIDTAVNDAFLRQMAQLGRGTCELVTPGESMEGALIRLSREIGTPLVTDIQLEDQGLHPCELAPNPIPDLYAARPVVVAGRRRGDGEVILRGRTEEGEWLVRLAPHSSTNPALGILWARQRVRSLEDQLRLGTAHQRAALEEEIRRLALDYGLLTRFTSFVLVDRSEVAVHEACQTLVQPVHLPAQWKPADDPGVTHLLNNLYGVTDLAEVEDTVKDISAQDFGCFEVDEEVALDKLKELVDEAPIIRLVNLILTQAVHDRASHIHVEPEAKSIKVRYRVDGILQEVMDPPKHIQGPLVARLKNLAGLDQAQRQLPQFGSYHMSVDGSTYRLALSTCPTMHGEKVVIKLCCLSAPVPTPAELGLPVETVQQLEAMMQRSRGLLLIAGSAGSGRSTLLASVLTHLAGDRAAALYDPGWLQPLEGVALLSSGQTVAQAMECLQSQDCDVVGLSGLLHGPELSRLMEISQRSLVVATWPAEEAATALLGLLSSGLSSLQVGETLVGVVSLRLLPRLCQCKRDETHPDVLASLMLAQGSLKARQGCDRCKMTGIHGRVLVAEVLEMSDSMRSVLESPPHTPYQIRTAAGYPSFFEQALRLAETGAIEASACLGPRLQAAPAQP